MRELMSILACTVIGAGVCFILVGSVNLAVNFAMWDFDLFQWWVYRAGMAVGMFVGFFGRLDEVIGDE